jgi:hypothetical protein
MDDKAMTKKRKRIVEMFVARSLSGGDSGDWWTVTYYVLADLPEEEAIAAVERELVKTYEHWDNIAFFGLYCYWNDDMMEGEWEEEDG